MTWRTIVAIFRDQRGYFDFGGSSSKQQQQAVQQVQAQPTAQQLQLQDANVKLANLQIAQIQAAMDQQNAYNASPTKALNDQTQQAVEQNLLNRVNGTSPVLSPEAAARVNQAYDASQKLGQQAIDTTFLNDANMRGMNPTDSPVANAKGLAEANFLTGLQGSRASSMLDVGNTEANFNAGLLGFTNQLQQQAFLNRLAVGQAAPTSMGLANTLFNQQYLTAPRTSSGSGLFSGTQYGLGLTGQQAGSGMQGLSYLL